MQHDFLPAPTISSLISTLDIIIFSLVIGATLLAIYWGEHLKKKTPPQLNPLPDTKKSAGKPTITPGFLDHLLMGRQLTLPMFVATLVATWYGGIFGVTAIAFEKGIYNFITQGVFWYITYLIFALFLVDRIKSYDAITLPDLVGKMFGPKSKRISAIFNFFNVVPIAYAVSLGLFLQSVFGGTIEMMTLTGVLFVVAYSIKGGFRAVVFSDSVQFFVMCLSVLFILSFSIQTFGGIGFLRERLPQSHFSWSGGESLWTVFAWGLIALSTLVDPNFYQRCFAAKSTKVAKTGILISTAIWVVFDISTTVGAMYAAAVIPEASSKTAYLIYSMQVLPEGFRGFVLAGILATILSTLDSYLFTASTTLTYDLMPQKKSTSKKLHHLGVIFVGGISIVLASIFEGDIKLIWKTLGSYSAACLLFPVMVGYFFPGKIDDNGFVYASIGGAIATTYWRLSSHQGVWVYVDDLYIGMSATAIILLLRMFRNSEKPSKYP